MAGPTAIYSRVQDQGGRTGRGHHTELPARPYVEPSVERARFEIESVFERAWGSVIG